MNKYIFCFIILLIFSGCGGCSKSGKYLSNIDKNSTSRNNIINKIKMIKEDGVYKIPVFVNGVQLYTIFDTGASLISISNTEAQFLYKQGTLTESDFEGSMDFQDATGKISTGKVVNLKSVQIGTVILRNVKASVVDNNSAPLLLGQSALSKFGKISIDYDNGILTFDR
jgi:aspartyl protease family protein